MFSWDISPSWQVETDRDKSSEVEVTTALTLDRTRVDIEHRHLASRLKRTPIENDAH